MTNYKIIYNIKDLPDYKSFSKISHKDEKNLLSNNPEFHKIRTAGRNHALSLMNLSEQMKETARYSDSPKGFDRYIITDSLVIEKISFELGLLKPSARIQVLPPGEMTMLHVDDLEKGYVFPIEESNEKISFSEEEIENFRNNPYSAVRFLIALEDSQPGQLYIFGDEILSNWKKGDVIYWDWKKTVHATVNVGFWDRPLIRISGLVTQKTLDIINNA